MSTMKITAVRIFEVQGVMEHEGEYWEERLNRPLDIYPEHKVEGPHWAERTRSLGQGKVQITLHFVRIETDNGVSGPRRPAAARPGLYYCQTAGPAADRPRSAGY